MIKRARTALHRGSIRHSYPVAQGSVLSITEELFLLELARFINGTALFGMISGQCRYLMRTHLVLIDTATSKQFYDTDPW